MKRIVFSLIRTIFAMLVIAASVVLFSKALSWTYWAPNNDYGFLVVSLMYLLGIFGVLAGGYYISPIFWTALSYALVPNSLSDEEYEANYREGRREIRKLRKWFVW